MTHPRHILALIATVLLFSVESLRAEVYTIDFCRGTVSGRSIKGQLTASVTPTWYCRVGASCISTISVSDSFYDEDGCGLRIGALNSNGKGFVTFTLSQEIQSKTIKQVVVYASRGTENESVSLLVTAGTVASQTVSYAEVKDYSSGTVPADYMLPALTVNGTFKQLQVKAPNTDYAVLHRIDIIVSDTHLALPAQSGDLNYATFSSNKATFFPEEVTVSKVSVKDGLLRITSLDLQNGMGKSGRYVPANTGVLLSSANANVSYYMLETEELSALSDNMLCPASQEMEVGGRYYKLAYDDYSAKTGLGFYWGAADGGPFDCKQGTAYLSVPNHNGAKAFVLSSVGDEDAIRLPQESADEMDGFYNLSGQKTPASWRGMYIKNGKKYVRK